MGTELHTFNKITLYFHFISTVLLSHLFICCHCYFIPGWPILKTMFTHVHAKRTQWKPVDTPCCLTYFSSKPLMIILIAVLAVHQYIYFHLVSGDTL